MSGVTGHGATVINRLDHLAETIKLSRLLGVSTERLAFLAGADPAALKAVREQLATTMSEDVRPMLTRAVKASKLLPVGLVAKMGERVMGPMLCAHMAAMMEPARAVEVSARMSDAFLADVSTMMEPRRAATVIAAMPRDRVVATAKILAQRGDYITLARFVAVLSEDTIKAVIEAIPDDHALLQTAFFVEARDALDRLVALVPLERLAGVVRLVARSAGELWTEALALLTHVGERWQRHIGELAAAEDDGALGHMIATIERLSLWPSVVPLLATLGEAAQRRLMALPTVRTAGVVGAIVRATDTTARWSKLLPIVVHMDEDLRRHVAAEVEALGPGVFERMIPLRDVLPTTPLETWPGLAAIALHLSPGPRAELDAILRGPRS